MRGLATLVYDAMATDDIQACMQPTSEATLIISGVNAFFEAPVFKFTAAKTVGNLALGEVPTLHISS